jgi:hypothetical protein
VTSPTNLAPQPKLVTSKAELKKQTATEAQARQAAEKAAQAQAKEPVAVKNISVMQPIESPAFPISADKAQRLQQLLQKYRVDEITPEQYHRERAKILAEP